jgi:hypothetical protein
MAGEMKDGESRDGVAMVEYLIDRKGFYLEEYSE